MSVVGVLGHYGINLELENLVSRKSKEYEKSENIAVDFSDAFSSVDLSSAENLDSKDGWHPSERGRELLARSSVHLIEDMLGMKASKPKK